MIGMNTLHDGKLFLESQLNDTSNERHDRERSNVDCFAAQKFCTYYPTQLENI